MGDYVCIIMRLTLAICVDLEKKNRYSTFQSVLYVGRQQTASIPTEVLSTIASNAHGVS